MDGKSVSESAIEQHYQVFPHDLNPLDSIYGGKVMALIDDVAALVAQKHSEHVCVTASVDSIDFLSPVKKGEVLQLKAAVNRVWETSCEVGVRVVVYNFQDKTSRHIASAYLTFVALGAEGRPVKMPPLISKTQRENKRFEEAEARRQMRLARRKKRS